MLFFSSKKPPSGLQFEISRKGSEKIVFNLKGKMNENVHLVLEKIRNEIEAKDNREIVFNLAEVSGMNSIAVHHWTHLMSKISPNNSVSFENCSPDVIMNIVINRAFLGNAFVRSFQAPYWCPSCEKNAVHTYQVAEIPPGTIPSAPECTCGTPLELDESPEEFFSFLS